MLGLQVIEFPDDLLSCFLSCMQQGWHCSTSLAGICALGASSDTGSNEGESMFLAFSRKVGYVGHEWSQSRFNYREAEPGSPPIAIDMVQLVPHGHTRSLTREISGWIIRIGPPYLLINYVLVIFLS